MDATIVEMIESVGVNLAADVGVMAVRRANSIVLKWLSTRAAQAQLLALSNRVVIRSVTGGISRALAINLACRTLSKALVAANVVLSGVGLAMFVIGVVALVYDLIDAPGYSKMLNKEEITSIVRIFRNEYDNEVFRQSGVANTLEIDPLLYDANVFDNPTNVEYYVEKVVEYLDALEINSRGEQIKRKNTFDSESSLQTEIDRNIATFARKIRRRKEPPAAKTDALLRILTVVTGIATLLLPL